MPERVLIAIVMSMFTSATCWIVWVLANNIRRAKADRRRAEVQSRLLDRFGSAPELLAYLQTDSGRSWVEFGARERPDPYARVLIAIQLGIVLAIFGAGLFGLMTTMSSGEARDVFQVLGWLGMTLGVGLLASGAASYALSRKWGLLERRPDGNGN